MLFMIQITMTWRWFGVIEKWGL